MKMSNANQIDFGPVSDLFLVAQGPLVASTSGVSSHPQQQQQQHQQQQQYHQQISSFQGLNLSIHHGLDLTCPNYQGLNLSLGQYVGVGLKAQAQKSSNSLPNPQQNSQSNQNNNSSNGRGLNLSQQQQGKSLPQQQHYQQQQQQQHLQQQQQQKVISNTNSGIRNNNNNLKRSEVGLNLSLQNGINLSSNRQQAPGPVDATSSNNSYYYTTNTSGGYINLSTQNYTSSALPSFTNNIGQTNSMQPSDGTAPQTSIFQSCTAEQTLRNSPLNLERNRSSPLNLTSAIPNGPFNPQQQQQQQQLFPPRNEQQNYSQFCQNTPLDFQVLNYTDSSMVNGCSNNYEMFPTQQQQQNFQQQYTHSSANGGGTGGGGYINLSGQSFNIPVSNDQFQTLNCNVANSTNLNNEAVPVTSSANAKVHSVGGVVQQQNGNVPLIADKTNRNSPLNLERHRASPLNLTSAVPNGPFNSQLQPQQQQQHPTFEPRNEQHQQSFQQMCSTAPLDFQVLNFSDPGMGNSYDNTFEMFSTQDQQQQQQQFQPFSQPSMSGSGQGQGGSSSKIRLFCSTCCQEFSSSSELTRHMEKHTTANGLISNNGERYFCSTCGVEMRDQQTLCSHMARTHGVKDNHQSFQQHQTQWQNQQQAGNNNGGGHFHSIDCSANINVEGTLMNLADGSNNAFASNSNQIPPVPAPSDLASAQASLNSSANPPHAFSSTLETPTTVSSSKAFQMTTTVGTTIAETPGSSSASAATASLATTLTATASKTTTGSADIGKSKSSTDNPNSTLEDRISSKEVPVTDEDKSQFPTEINYGAAENSSSVKIPEHLPSIKDNSSDTLDPNNKGSASTVPTECIVVPTAPNNSSSKDLTDEPEQSCFDCNLTFRSGLDLKKHIDLAHKGRRAKGTLYQCLVCSEKFQDKTSHKEHMDAHAREKPFKCSKCGKHLTNQTVLNRHMKRVHEKKLPFGCDECGKRFYERYDLQKHIQRTHVKLSLLPKCGICKKPMANEKHEARHKKTCIDPKELFPCEICDAKLETKVAWGCHMWKHTKDSKYILPVT